MYVEQDLTGQRFGKLLVCEKTLIKAKNHLRHYICKCDCGNYSIVKSNHLITGETKSCGCKKSIGVKYTKVQVGDVFERLTVVERIDKRSRKNGNYWYKCICVCGNIVEVAGANLTAGRNKSCACLKNELSGIRLSGENNPLWAGGITPENQKIRQQVTKSGFRKNVLARDNYTCQKCNQIGGKLNAHHIANFADNPEERFSVDNGITLCVTCHKEFHHHYGNRNNTPEQLDIFLKGIENVDLE